KRHAAASYAHEDLIKYLLEKGANVNIQDLDGDSPLFVCETVEIAEILVEAGADAKHVNENEMTAAENAEEEEWYEVAHYLRELTGVPHPDKDVDDLEEDMSHLLKDEDEDNSDEEDGDDKDEEAKENSFKHRIESIMKATEADGVDRDEELKSVVAEMLVAAGPERGEALAKELQAQEDKNK
ncbi:hypothetical protein EDD21DRAFT_389743, partial [Dissophora ornata]